MFPGKCKRQHENGAMNPPLPSPLPQLVPHGEADPAPLAGDEAQEPEELQRVAGGGEPADHVGAQQEPNAPPQQRQQDACAASQEQLRKEGLTVQRPEGGGGGGGARGTGCSRDSQNVLM